MALTQWMRCGSAMLNVAAGAERLTSMLLSIASIALSSFPVDGFNFLGVSLCALFAHDASSHTCG